jgi:hypothetical protein
MAEPAPLQPELPFDASSGEAASRPTPPPRESAALDPASPVPAWRPAIVEEPPASVSEQLVGRLRELPWSRWRALAEQVLSRGGNLSGFGGRTIRLGAAAAGTAMAQGAPYAATLARNTARAGLVRAALRMGALAVHVAGFPAVVTRTAIQLTAIHRAGLAVESATYFEAGDPAGYVVYQAPADLGTGIGIAFIPAGILMVLAIVCLAPVLTPRATLHLPVSLLTWTQIWLGLGFAAHALPIHDEAGPLAEQARAGVARAEPLALLTIVPAKLVAWVTASGGLLPAILGVAAALFVSGTIWR